MPRMLVLTIALLSSTVVPGCATTTYAPAPKGESGTAAVFIRQNAEPTAWNLSVLIDGTKAASISNGSYSRFSVEPGRHMVHVHWPALSSQVDVSGQVDFPKDQTSYFLLTGKSRLTGSGYHALYFSMSTAFVPLTKNEAEPLLQEIKSR